MRERVTYRDAVHLEDTFSAMYFRVYVSQSLWIYMCVANVCIAMAVGFVMVLMFEAPIMHLEKLLFGALGLAKLPRVTKYKTQ